MAGDPEQDEEGWKLLPAIQSGERGLLPNFVKAVALHLPRTAAAMLELDAAHRLRGPIPPRLRAKLRWVIARANRCRYGQETALNDLRRAGGDETEIFQLVGNPEEWPESDTGALHLVRNLTLDASTVSDGDFEALRKQHGDKMVAAMVMLAAYGNFQDRILLGLQVPLESHGPLAPLDVRFEPGALQRTAIVPDNPGFEIYLAQPDSHIPADLHWTSVSHEQLQARLDAQRKRQPRLPIPSWAAVQPNLPVELAKNPTKIRWSLVNYGYVPELAIPWTTATRTHWSECPAERILEESLFWVQTRAVNCNYCMGHCEMLLQVAGLNEEQVVHRIKALAETDWSLFPPAEQRAYDYARKLTQQPWALTREDLQVLEDDFGSQKAMSIFWWLCRGLYMTRISDGFQLPLEEHNVFNSSI